MQKTAIIIFAISAKAECLHKKLLNDAHDNFKLFEQLNNRISAEVKKAGIPYFLFDENVQEGATYGERIVNAMAIVYSKGFENVIIVWNDCPNLGLQHIEKAIAEVPRLPLVIGPDHWGGVYLLGVSKSVFDSARFATLYWQSNVLAASLMHSRFPKYFLPKLRVLNSRYSMRMFLLRAFFEKVVELLPVATSIKIARNKLRLIFIKLHLMRPAT